MMMGNNVQQVVSSNRLDGVGIWKNWGNTKRQKESDWITKK